MNVFYLTDTGKIRDHNEDNVVIVKNSSGDYLLAVADGMGGHLSGEIASTIAINRLSERFKQGFKDKNKAEAANWFREVTLEINDLLFSYVAKHPESKGMGTTLVACVVTKDYILMANVGDSSGFVIKEGKLRKVTEDHTLVNLLLKAGKLSVEEAEAHPKKNVLMRALGANNPVEVDVFDCITDIDGVLLASDGLTNMLDNETIESVINSDETIDEKVVKLINKANNRGGTDNISVAYLEFSESGE